MFDRLRRLGREFSELNTRYWSRYSVAPDSPRRQALRELEDELARGADSTGKANTAEEKRRLETVIRQRNGELEELAKGVKALVVTLGAKGSLVIANGRSFEIPAVKPAQVVDPTGCGDAYRAGLLYGVAAGLDWPLTGRLAMLLPPP